MEVYHLNDAANASIPPDIRAQFHTDAQGRVLFFTAPPLDEAGPVEEMKNLGHSARYLAAKAEREKVLAAKRKAEASEQQLNEERTKKARLQKEDAFVGDVANLTLRAVETLDRQLAGFTKADLQDEYEGRWQKGLRLELEKTARLQVAEAERRRRVEESERVFMEREKVVMKGLTAGFDGGL